MQFESVDLKNTEDDNCAAENNRSCKLNQNGYEEH